MTFTVVWRPEAERKLAALWSGVPDRQAVSSWERKWIADRI